MDFQNDLGKNKLLDIIDACRALNGLSQNNLNNLKIYDPFSKWRIYVSAKNGLKPFIVK
jgi:hypothetical protein